MNTSRLLTALAVILVLGWGVRFGLRPAGDAGAPTAGILADFDASLASTWHEVARIDHPDVLGLRIHAVDAAGDTVLIVQSGRWLLIVDGTLLGPFGSTVRGSPTWLARGIAGGFSPQGIVILDAGRNVLSLWSTTGERLAERELRLASGYAVQHQALAVDASGRVLVQSIVTHDDGSSPTEVRYPRFGDDARTQPDTLVHRLLHGDPSAAYATPLLATRPDGSYVTVNALTWQIEVYGATDGLAQRAVRATGPRWATPDSVRRHLARFTEQMDPRYRNGMQFPALIPPVRGITRSASGHLITLSADANDHLHAEVLQLDGSALGRLWRLPEPLPVFAAGGALYRLRELDDVTVLERQTLSPGAP